MRALWQGLLSFGLINIPVKMFKATENKDYHFTLLHNVCHSPIKYRRYCTVCDQEVQNENIVKGYEYEKDRYILVTDEELEQIASPRTKTIEILAFLKKGDVPLSYYDDSYYLQPAPGGEKAYSLLGQALNSQNKEALCRLVLRTKPKLCLVSFGQNVLRLSTIHFATEVRSPEMLGQMPIYEVTAAELELAELLITKLTRPFVPEEFPNTYRQALNELVQRKLSGQEIHVAQKTPEPQVANILEALQASLEKVESNGVPTYAR